MRKHSRLAALLILLAAASCGPAANTSERPNVSPIPVVSAQSDLEVETPEIQARRAAALAAADRLDFGAIPLRTPISALPPGARWQSECPLPAIEGCGFDLNGIRYGTHWDDNIVVIKIINVGEDRVAGLPFGLRGDETMETALADLNAQFNGAFEIGTNDTGEQFVIAHVGDEGAYFEVSLRFEREGRLSKIRASCCYD